jgi:hypothetical protein
LHRSAVVLGLGLLFAVTASSDRLPVPRAHLPARVTAHPGTSSLPAFASFGWLSPPADSTSAARYAELAEVGFNLTLPAWEDPSDVAENLYRMQAAAPSGLRSLVVDARFAAVQRDDAASRLALQRIVNSYLTTPSLLGYYLGDEPTPDRFPELAVWFALLREIDPTHPGWNNLLGRGVFSGREQFLDYLRAYCEQVRPAVLCTDHYDHLVGEDRGLFVDNVSATAQVAREYGLPFWGIALVTPHLRFRVPDDGLLRWQAAQWLAHGARGLGWFTYWTPAPDSVHGWQPGMIAWDTGERTARYAQVQRLQGRITPVGEALAGMAWISTEYAGGAPLGGAEFQPDSLVLAVEGRAVVGTFTDASGSPVLFVANRDSSATRTLALEVAGERRVQRLSGTGAWSAQASEATPRGRRIVLTLAPGDFELLRLDGVCPSTASGGCTARLTASPNPATARVRFGATEVVGEATLVITDLAGRRVWGRMLTGGAPVVEWDGRDESGRRVVPGFYWARLTDARGAVVRRVAWLGGR